MQHLRWDPGPGRAVINVSYRAEITEVLAASRHAATGRRLRHSGEAVQWTQLVSLTSGGGAGRAGREEGDLAPSLLGSCHAHPAGDNRP